jgi:hypothetical protein
MVLRKKDSGKIRWLVYVKKICALVFALFILATTITYVIGKWYIYSHRNTDVEFGATFITDYARELGVDPHDVLNAAVDDLGIRRFRLVSYWDKIENTKGTYDFSDLDWQFKLLEEKGAKITLAIGLRQPRWPECHIPSWANGRPINEWREDLDSFMVGVVNRYKTSPSLISYQLENEFFLSAFGECPDYDRQRLVDEFNLVKSLDSMHPIAISRSNNATLSWPINAPRADIVGGSIYKRVYDRVSQRYFEYPIPAWFYGFLAEATNITTDRDMFVHELQAEPWPAPGFAVKDAPVEELYKTMNSARLAERLDYAKKTGMKTVDLWGLEWWYQMRQLRDNPELWETVRTVTRPN